MTESISRLSEDLQDIAFYLQSLLQLMIADDHLHPAEQDRVREYGRLRGYSDRFIEETMASALTNRHITRIPPRFHSSETAERFLKDAVVLAHCDGVLHEKELRWLIAAALTNGFDPDEFFSAMPGIPSIPGFRS